VPATPSPTRPREEAPPLARLWRYMRRHRARTIWAVVLSVLNKLFDVVPEILIGIAIDVVVTRGDSLVADITGVEDRCGSAADLAARTRWRGWPNRPSEWGYQLLWRNHAQTVEHEARMDAYRHVQELDLAYFEDQSTAG